MLQIIKKGNKGNLALLVYLHLLLLSYPILDKAFHHHLLDLNRHEVSNQVSFDHPEQHCPVCDFEFYSFITATQLKATVFFIGIPVFNSPAPEKHYPRVINYFSLRAPPTV